MITYQTEGVEMPAIKKRETTAWIKAVAETYGKKYCKNQRTATKGCIA